MVAIKYNINITEQIIINEFKKLINQVYKLLPLREEGTDWQKPLETTMVQLSGMKRLFDDQQELFFSLLCKLEGLFTLTKDTDFQLYRRTIFECLGMLNILSKNVTQL